jgi:cytidine deaminase
MASNHTSADLIARAAKLLHPYETNGRVFGDVAAVVVSSSGKVYEGVCIDTPSWGICAERTALSVMVTQQEYKIKKVVAVWRDGKKGKLYVLPPCGVCREFMRQIDEKNLQAEVILGRNKSEKLATLLPYHEWPTPEEE